MESRNNCVVSVQFDNNGWIEVASFPGGSTQTEKLKNQLITFNTISTASTLSVKLSTDGDSSSGNDFCYYDNVHLYGSGSNIATSRPTTNAPTLPPSTETPTTNVPTTDVPTLAPHQPSTAATITTTATDATSDTAAQSTIADDTVIAIIQSKSTPAPDTAASDTTVSTEAESGADETDTKNTNGAITDREMIIVLGVGVPFLVSVAVIIIVFRKLRQLKAVVQDIQEAKQPATPKQPVTTVELQQIETVDGQPGLVTVGEDEKKNNDDNDMATMIDDGANRKAEGVRPSVFRQRATTSRSDDDSDSEQLYGTQKSTTGAGLGKRSIVDSDEDSDDVYEAYSPPLTTTITTGK